MRFRDGGKMIAHYNETVIAKQATGNFFLNICSAL